MGGIVNIVGVPQFDKLEVVKTGTITHEPFTVVGTSTTQEDITITHNLGYLPIVLAYYQDEIVSETAYNLWGGSYWDSYTVGASITPLVVYNYSLFIDVSELTLRVDVLNSSSSFDHPGYQIVYYLLRARTS